MCITLLTILKKYNILEKEIQRGGLMGKKFGGWQKFWILTKNSLTIKFFMKNSVFIQMKKQI